MVTTATARRQQGGSNSGNGDSNRADGAPDTTRLHLPAEALIRLVYGRLDPEHTPAIEGDADLDALRRTFPGF